MDLLKEFQETGALLSGHFKLSSGLHSDRYLQCATLLQWPDRAEKIGRLLADQLRPAGAAAVVSPALGGVIVGHEVARALGVRALFTERKDGRMQLRRGFRLGPSERVVVVEDVFTTGKSTRETIQAISELGGSVVAAGSIVDRGLPPGALPVPAKSLLALEVPSWPADQCPLCAEGFPVESPGSRHAAG
ncbi:MAG: orotate phosphoribosyltransferase [Thermoanaerobaculia bacterium]